MFEQKKLMSKIGIIFLTWRRLNQKKIQSQDITLKQFHILKCLSKKDYMYPSDIADEIYADRPTVTVILNNLEKQNLITRQPNSLNKKMIQIRITKKGIDKKNDVLKFLSQEENEILPTSCFTAEELQQFHYLLNKLFAYFKLK